LKTVECDYADQLRHVEVATGQDVYFVYDSSGRRTRKVYEHSGLLEERIYLGGYEIYRKTTVSTGTLEVERETVHISDDARRVCMVETLTVDGGSAVGTPTPRYRFQLDNHLGTACVEVDELGAVISYEEYHPYGTSAYRAWKTGVAVSAKRYRYTGKERDEETGLYYHGARYYAPWLGRWMSADPAGTVDGTNLFAYVWGSPVVMSDPSGMASHGGFFDPSFQSPAPGAVPHPFSGVPPLPKGTPATGVGITPLGSGGGDGAGGSRPVSGQSGSAPAPPPPPAKPVAPNLYYPTDQELAVPPEQQFGMRKNVEVSAAPVKRQATFEEDLTTASAALGLAPGVGAEVTVAVIDVGLAANKPTTPNVIQAAASVTAIFIVGAGSGWVREFFGETLDTAHDLSRLELPDVPVEGTADEILSFADQMRHADIPNPAKLTPYAGSGGHHVFAKRAFEGVKGYDPKAALAVTDAELARLGVRHSMITGAQSSLYSKFAKTGRKLTLGQMASIETKALIQVGMDPAVARATVDAALAPLRQAGIQPIRIPWGGK
jgi:RHS repeat-associated protein